MKICVIGGGILGMTIAFELLERGAQVIHLYEPSRKGGATQCAGAMLNSFAEIDKYSLKSDEAISHLNISMLATAEWPKFEKRLIEAAGDKLPTACSKCQILTGGCFRRGTYVVNNTTSDQLDDDNFAAIRSALTEFNQPFVDVEPSEIPGYLPSPTARALRALLIHDEGWLNPKIVLEKLEAILNRSDKYEHIPSNALTIKLDSDQSGVAESNDGRKTGFDACVLANGFDMSRLIEESGLNLPHFIYSGVGVSLEIETFRTDQSHCIRTPNRGGACGLYTVPYFWGPDKANSRILVGASNFTDVTPHFYGKSISIAHLLDAATREINQNYYSAELISVNVGNRPTTYDQYPLLGRLSQSNIYVAGGTKRDGFHLAPIIGRYIAELVLGNKADNQFSAFDPLRSPILDLTIEQGIELNVESLKSEAYQHGYLPATIRGLEQFERVLRDEVSLVHETRNPYPGRGIPMLMYKLARDGRLMSR